jgi:uncharacterized protein (TIGR02145 family)
MKLVTFFAIFCMFFISSCSDDSPCSCPNSDSPNDTIEKDNFEVVKIGSQVWMSKNLEVTTFRNGDSIFHAQSKADWLYASENNIPAWCYYAFEKNNGETYGKLYNWHAVSNSRGLAPSGYHVPSDREWTILIDYLGGSSVAGKKLKSRNGWFDNGNGTNISGFSGLPGGFCNYFGNFNDIGTYGYWWSSMENNADRAWFRNVFYGTDTVITNFSGKCDGFSVRCLRD